MVEGRGRRLPGTSLGCAAHAVASRQVAHLTLPRAGRAVRTSALTPFIPDTSAFARNDRGLSYDRNPARTHLKILLQKESSRLRTRPDPSSSSPGKGPMVVRFSALLVLAVLSPLAHGGESSSAAPGGSSGGAALDGSVREAGVCQPWPDCVAKWLVDAVQERERAGTPLEEAEKEIRQGWEQNCTRTAQCSPDKRIEEIDEILSRVQAKWEKQAGSALAARNKVEDNLWKEWIQRAQDRVKDMERLSRARAEEEAALTDIWVRRMSTISIDASLIPIPQVRPRVFSHSLVFHPDTSF